MPFCRSLSYFLCISLPPLLLTRPPHPNLSHLKCVTNATIVLRRALYVHEIVASSKLEGVRVSDHPKVLQVCLISDQQDLRR